MGCGEGRLEEWRWWVGEGKEHWRGVFGVVGNVLLGGRKGLWWMCRWFSLAARRPSCGRGLEAWGIGWRRKEERRDAGVEARRVLGARELRLLGERREVVGREELRDVDMVGGWIGCWGGVVFVFEVWDLR